MTEKKLSFRSECLKIQAKKTVIANFNTTVRQMTKMFQRKNREESNHETFIYYVYMSSDGPQKRDSTF